MRLTLGDVQQCLTGLTETCRECTVINAVRTDSRAVEPGDLFFCIEGWNFDGHEFAHQAEVRGAVAVVASRPLVGLTVPVIVVRDTVRALGRLASCWRDLCGARLVAVTGTAGKTTVKEMLAAVLSRKFAVAKNYRNLNNQIGLPVSMLKADSAQPVWVMELGISVKGDMEELAVIASPDVAVITNAGPGHLEGLGDVTGVARAKTSLLKYLRQDGVAVVSRDYPELWEAATALVPEPAGFSTRDESAPFYAEALGADDDGRGRFRLRTPDGDGEFSAPFCGEHYAENVACVAAAAKALGLSRNDVVAGVQTVEPDCQRFCCRTSGRALIIDDTYNANPLSMARSIRTAAAMTKGRPLVLVLGDMRELGGEAKERHEELGRLIREVVPLAVFYKGAHLDDVARGIDGGAPLTRIEEPEPFMAQWRALETTEAVVLVKGSRSLKMEAFAAALCRELQDGAATEGGAR
ncbi:MAG: UDP-N-acetylmuramoyl-tripeptide--D-alanyl-D-alanine ligase [Pseudomonadota bacterium]